MSHGNATLAARKRQLRVRIWAINEERRIGSITIKEALDRMRAVHEELGWPLGRKSEPKGDANATQENNTQAQA
jgi:hypothetical protein